ncbi:MAG: hypothetical protein GTN99_02920 [Candidatus Dadabacteria bacterium]|nr:hypothetical protein [Candidatus Dadabacteria bacterium]
MSKDRKRSVILESPLLKDDTGKSEESEDDSRVDLGDEDSSEEGPEA